MAEFLVQLGQFAVLIFVICQMLSMGLVLTVPQILSPLKNTRLLILALVANFVVVPVIAIAIVSVFPLPQGYAIGLILIGCAAGAPFLPKMAQIAKGDIAYSVGLMVLLMVVSIVFLPIILPLIIKGVIINPLDIAKSLVFLMLVPLGIALVVRARYKEVADHLAPYFAQATNIALIILIFAFLVGYMSELIGFIGTTVIVASLVFILIAFGVGYLLGGPGADTQKVLGFGTGLRGFSAAFAVATLNFTDPQVIMGILVIVIVSLVVFMFLGAELGKRAGSAKAG